MSLHGLREDVAELRRAMTRSGEPAGLGHALSSDAFLILLTWRLRCAARRFRVPGLNHLLRRIQTVAFGIEIGNDVTLGRGVYFIHPVGIVVGGAATVGPRVRFMGSNTVGTARGDGHPAIEDDAVIGCGARILGGVRVGARAIVGANAVVLDDIPADVVAVGMPARPTTERSSGAATWAGANDEARRESA